MESDGWRIPALFKVDVLRAWSLQSCTLMHREAQRGPLPSNNASVTHAATVTPPLTRPNNTEPWSGVNEPSGAARPLEPQLKVASVPGAKIPAHDVQIGASTIELDSGCNATDSDLVNC